MSRGEFARHLIGRIYEAAVDPARWAGFAEGLAGALGDAAVGVYLLPPNEMEEPLYFRAGYHPGRQPVFTRRFLGANPWRTPEAMAAHIRGFICSRDYVSDEALRSTDFYREWMEPLGLGMDLIMASFGVDETGEPSAGVIVHPHAQREAFGAEDAAFADLLFPHLRRAYQIYRRLVGMEQERGALAEVISRLPAGVVLLDAQRRVLMANPIAQRLIDLRDGFVVDRNGPRLSYSDDDEPFQEAVTLAIEAGVVGRPGPDPVLVGRRPSGHRPLIVIVTRLMEPLPGFPLDSAVAAVFLGNALTQRPVSRDLLMRLYSLTPAEADLVSLLCDGLSLERAAERRGVRLNTVRWQVKQVFSKTGARSQVDLVRLVVGATAPVTGE